MLSIFVKYLNKCYGTLAHLVEHRLLCANWEHLDPVLQFTSKAATLFLSERLCALNLANPFPTHPLIYTTVFTCHPHLISLFLFSIFLIFLYLTITFLDMCFDKCFPHFFFIMSLSWARLSINQNQWGRPLIAISHFARLGEQYFTLAWRGGGKLPLATRQIKCRTIVGGDRKARQLAGGQVSFPRYFHCLAGLSLSCLPNLCCYAPWTSSRTKFIHLPSQ